MTRPIPCVGGPRCGEEVDPARLVNGRYYEMVESTNGRRVAVYELSATTGKLHYVTMAKVVGRVGS